MILLHHSKFTIIASYSHGWLYEKVAHWPTILWHGFLPPLHKISTKLHTFSFLILIQTSHITTHQYRTNSLTQLTRDYNQVTKISSNSRRFQNLSTHFNPSYAYNLHPRPSSITRSCDASMAPGLVNHYWPNGFLYRSPHHVPSILTVDLVDPL